MIPIPGSAGRHPGILPRADNTEDITAEPPWTCNSQQSSPVKLWGPVIKKVTISDWKYIKI